MAGKAHGNGDRRGDNTICGLGDRLRRLTAGICLITQTIFPVMAAAPTHINPAHSDTAASLILPNVKTIPYTLGALESPPTVAARFGITVDELRRLNQFRTFARGFDNVRQGDEIDVPLINSNSPEARNLKAMQMERDGKDPQMQVAEMAQQSGTLLARDMDSEQAASMARGWVASSASAQATDWLSRWGTARVSLGVDEDFSLKSSSFEFLHPWYETPYNLVFSQHTLHRTDDRTQTNHGIGWRYFTSSWMSGVNMFIDHDLTRYHTRTGMGVEYWRDYLKLSGNGYLRLSNWRSAPELDNDYEARPANGWDLRAEGWLPAWPQLGGKLVYEQYYGDEVALFGKDERQNDPHAITAGLSYTPVPLISFSAEQRQGKQGENDTRIGMELTLQPGHSLQKQLDPAEVAARRSLVGSRYDLVDRNNNIVLEYRKKELVRLTLTDPLKGKPGEVKSLVSSLQTKYALKGYDIEAASLQSAGGKVAVSGKDIQVTIPPYRFTAMPETDNTYPIAVTAEDSKGNFSRREESMVVVEKPTLNLTDSTLSVDQQILLADGKSTSTLTYTARDSSGKPIPGMTLKTQVKGLQDFALSEWKDNGNGTYTQIVTAGKTSGALSLMPQFNGDDIAKTPALIAIVANTASRADSTIETGQDNYVAGKPIVVKVTLRDDNGNGVTGRKELLKQTVKVDNTKADDVSAWTEESEGIYKASYTAQLTMPGWQTKHSDAFSIAGDKDTAKIAAMQITANNAVARRDHNTVAVTVRDVHQNLLQGQNVTFTVVNGAAVFADPNGGIVTTDKDGIASVNLASDQAVNSLIKAEINGSSQSVEVSFITGDISQLTSTIKTDDVSYTAGGKIKVSVTLMDEQKNRVKGMASLLAGSSVVEVSGTDKNETGNWSEESDGVYTTTRTAKIAGDRHYATLKLSTWSSAQQSDAYAIRESGAVLAYSSIVTDKTAYTAGGAIKVTVTLKDSYENLVGGQRDAINLAIQLPNTKAESIAWNEDQKGIYTATYTALLPGTGLKAQLQMSGWANALTSNDYSISGDAASAQIVAMQVTTGNPDVLANGSDRHTVNVRVEDQFGNVLPEQTVTFTVTKGAAVFANTGQSADIRTDAHGMAEVDLSSTVADASTVEAKINQSSDSKTVNFVADVSTAQVAELVVTQDGSVADGATANTLRARVTDAFGNALAGQTVSVLAGNGATTAPTVTTQPDGTVEISVTSQTAGTSVITASVNNSSQSRNVTFIADVSTAQIADLVVSQDNAVADGATANTLQVRVTDAFGNALAGQTVSVLADNGATVAPVVTTQPDGTVEISVTSQTAGSSAVTVSINSSSQSRDVTFIADVRTAQIADLVVIKDDSVADGAMANMLRARVTDVFGNALAGQTVSVMADNGAAVASTMTTKPDGTVEISVTSQTAGISVVTASINNSSQSQNVTFVADVRTAKIADLVVSQDNAVADGSTANTLRARVTDAFGNTLAGQTVSVMAGNGATVAPTVITEPDGTAEISVTSQTAGVSAVTASINNSSQSRDVTFIADVRTAQIASLEVTQDNAVADGAMANTLQVRVTDANGNTLAGQTVSVLADNGATVAPTVITGQDGTVEISVTSQTAGTSAVTASINSSTASRNVTFVADVRTAQIASLEVTQDNSVADGAMANTLRVKVTDAFGNTLAGQTVSVSAGNSATTAPTVITEPDGTVEISVTSRTAGVSAVTATINNSSLSRNVTFIADVRTAKIADLVVTRDNSVADGAMANTLRVRVTDAFGNTLAGQTVSVLADNGATTAPTVITGQDGTVEISVTSRTAGISTVTATINSSSQSQNVTFIADIRTAQIADLVVIKDGSVADGSTANMLRVRVTDAFGNVLAGQTVSVLAGNGATVASTVTTKPDGTVEISVTSQTAGISAVTASINSSSQSQNVTFVADVRTAKIADLVVIKDGSEADGSTANTLRVRVTDAFGNALNGQTVSVLADNSATVAPTVTTQPDGTVEISVTSQTAGISAVTASINNSSQSRNVTFIADVRTAQIADLVVIKDGSEADGATANTLRARVTDAFGNVLAGQTVSVLAGNGATVAPTVITGQDGTVEISVTSHTAGVSAVTATINNSSQSRNVTFVADVRTAQIADLVVTRDNSVADGAMANTLRVRVTDAFGNVLAGQTVSVLADNGATVAPTVTTQPDGTEEISVTSQTAGISAVTASINNSSQSRNVTFIADVRTAQIASLEVTQDNAVADGAMANTLQVRGTDANGNTLAGQTVSVMAGNGATVAPAVTTQPDGTVEIPVTSQTAGASAVTASINSSSQSRNVTFVADVRTAKIADLVVIKDGSVADGATANTLQARVTDAFGNALAGQTVSVLADNSATVAPAVITEPDGTVDISVTSQTAGISTVTATINNHSLSQSVMFIADVRTAQIADLVVIKDGSEADGATANTLRARVTDANGNALAGQTVSVLAGNSATVAPTVTTQPDGTVEISVTSQTAGTSTVTASINNSSQSQNVTFVPGDASRLTSTVETNKSNYTVGETITITVTLRDAFDNLVTGAASQLAADGVLTVAGTDPSETGSWVESGGVYTTTRMATIASTNQHANLQLQTWSDGVTSDRYDIQSGSPAQATSTIATDKNAYTAGDTITVAVTLKDAHGNLVEGGESLLSGDNVTVEGAVRSGGWSETAGVYTATWSAQMAGDSHHATLKLSEWGSSKQSESYSIHSGAPVQANSAIRTDKSAYIAGEPLTVTITLRDEFGNPALGLTSEVIESYIDSFAVGGATPDSMRWVEQNNGEYTIVWTAWVAEENLVASLKLKTWATEIKSSLYGIQPGAAAKNQSTIVADKTIYIAGDSITVTVVLKDAQGNFITDGVVQLNEENVQVRNADPIQGNNWVYNGNGQYQRQYMAHFAEANLNAQLKMAGWSDANYSNNYTIKPGEVSPLGSQLRIREVLVVEGADLPVSVLLVDDFGNPVDNGLDLLDDTVYLQNVEKKEGEKWRYVGDGIYERTYMAYQEGENLTSFMEIKGWRIYGQPSYTILP
ncbi:Ig-like domain-containing protein, partial [Escherichia coli]|nr:Ig-like domain-containing protein [Escherichia coli]EJH4507646.1 Ig-like domain-containing protein [Escherichia coli]